MRPRWQRDALDGRCGLEHLLRQEADDLTFARSSEGEKDRGVAISPTAAHRLDHFLLAEGPKPHRRIAGARQLERQPQILPRQLKRKARVEVAAQVGGG